MSDNELTELRKQIQFELHLSFSDMVWETIVAIIPLIKASLEAEIEQRVRTEMKSTLKFADAAFVEVENWIAYIVGNAPVIGGEGETGWKVAQARKKIAEALKEK